MTTEEIIEGNKLIAEFMGFQKCNCIRNENGKYYDYYLSDKFELIKEVKICIEGEHGFGLENQDMCFIEDLKFHSSYDWIHPVVVKINELIGFKTIDECTDFENHMFTIIFGMKFRTPIEEVFGICVEFIKWYNEQSK